MQRATAAIDDIEAGINRSHCKTTFLGFNHPRDTSQTPGCFAEILRPMIHFPFANLSIERNPQTPIAARANALNVRVGPGIIEGDWDQFAVLQFRKRSMSRDPNV